MLYTLQCPTRLAGLFSNGIPPCQYGPSGYNIPHVHRLDCQRYVAGYVVEIDIWDTFYRKGITMSGNKVIIVVMVLVSVLIAGCTAVQIYPIGNTRPVESGRGRAHTTAYIIVSFRQACMT